MEERKKDREREGERAIEDDGDESVVGLGSRKDRHRPQRGDSRVQRFGDQPQKDSSRVLATLS